jgi:hypothetical protein
MKEMVRAIDSGSAPCILAILAFWEGTENEIRSLQLEIRNAARHTWILDIISRCEHVNTLYFQYLLHGLVC